MHALNRSRPASGSTASFTRGPAASASWTLHTLEPCGLSRLWQQWGSVCSFLRESRFPPALNLFVSVSVLIMPDRLELCVMKVVYFP